jgi:HEAT repeat protein
MDFRIEELHRLIASPEAPRRLHGFLRLEERLRELPTEGVEKLLSLADADPDSFIEEIGRRLRRAFQELQQEIRLPHGGPSVLELEDKYPSSAPDSLVDLPPEIFSRSAVQLLEPSLDLLESLLLARIGALVPEAIRTACSVRSNRLLSTLRALSGSPHYASEVAQGLGGWGTPEARSLLQDLAAAPGPAQTAALQSLAESKDPEGLTLLCLMADSDSPEIRKVVAQGLSSFPSPEAIPVLHKLLSDPRAEVQLAAISSWSRQRDPVVQETLLELLRFRSEDDRLRAQVVAELRDHPSEEAQDILVGLLKDPNARVRANAIEALAGYEYGVQKAVRLFQPLTHDGAARVRGNAVLALSLTHPPLATEALLEMFDCYEAPIRQAAAYCAGMIQSGRATERLALMMRTEQNQEVLGTAIRALSRIRGDRAQEILRSFAVKKSYGPMCVAAINLLADLGQASAVPPLIRLAREAEEADVRAAAARGISSLAAHQCLSYLPRLLADPSPEVVTTAIEGLERSGHLEAIGLLNPLLHSRSPQIRGSAVTALWHLGEFSSVRSLENLLGDEGESSASAGLRTLACIGRSLRLAPLGERPLFRQALIESFRRNFPDDADLLRRPPPPAPPEPFQAPPPPLQAEDSPSVPEAQSDQSSRLLEGQEQALTLLEQSYDVAESPPEQALEALSHNPRSAELLQASLRLLLSRGEPERVKNLERILQTQEDFYLTPAMLLAREAHQRGDLPTSMGLRLQIAREQIRIAQSLIEEAETALHDQELGAAQSATRLLASLVQAPPRLHSQLGDHAMAQGRFLDAQGHFLKAFMAFPGEGVLALKLAAAATRSGALKLAQKAAKAAYRRDPDGPIGKRARPLLQHLQAKK